MDEAPHHSLHQQTHHHHDLQKIVFFAKLNLYLPYTNTNKKALEERK
jgi:hypothetical protein